MHDNENDIISGSCQKIPRKYNPWVAQGKEHSNTKIKWLEKKIDILPLKLKGNGKTVDNKSIEHLWWLNIILENKLKIAQYYKIETQYTMQKLNKKQACSQKINTIKSITSQQYSNIKNYIFIKKKAKIQKQ